MAKPLLPDCLNICMIAQRFPISGRAAKHGFLWPIANELSKRGHKVTILSWKNPQGQREVKENNIQAYFLGENTIHKVKDFPQLALNQFEKLHKETPFHIVHSIDDKGLLIGRSKKKLNVAMTYGVEATEMAQVFSILGMSQESLGNQIRTALAVTYKFLTTFLKKDRKLLKTADGIFVTSPLQKIVLERHYLYPDLKTFSIPYGAEVGSLEARESSDEIKAELNLPESSFNIVTVTDMEEVGELRMLLKALEKVCIKKPSTRLIVVGHGPQFKNIEFESLNLALGSKVIFTGSIPNQKLPDYIALADVFINLSSRTTGFEPSILEAMAQKKVIIGSEVSPISTIVEDGLDGFLIRPADVSSLYKLLLEISSSRISKQQIGENARGKIIDIFDTEKMANLTINAYKKTLCNNGYFKSPSAQILR